MDMTSIQQIAVSLSAMIATITFIYKVFDDRSSRQEKDILDWQKTVVHQIFQKSKSPWISFETIIGSYRGEAADVPNRRLPREVLTSAALRKILISMVSERIIDQRGGDEYQLLTYNRDEAITSRMKQAFGSNLTEIMTSMNETMARSQEHAKEANREFAQMLAKKVNDPLSRPE